VIFPLSLQQLVFRKGLLPSLSSLALYLRF